MSIDPMFKNTSAVSSSFDENPPNFVLHLADLNPALNWTIEKTMDSNPLVH